MFLAHIHQKNTEREHDNFLLLIQEEIAMLLIFLEQLHFILPLHQLFVPIPDFQYFIYASKKVIIPANVELKNLIERRSTINQHSAVWV